LRIAQIAPLYESVPPRNYGGTERVVSHLTERLVELGHDVTLFASGDSRTSATLISPCPRSLRTDPRCVDAVAHHMIQLDQVVELADDFDIIHFHSDYFHLPLSKNLNLPSVTTLHGRLDIPDLFSLYRRYAAAPLVSISYAQRKPLPRAGWIGNVYHGYPLDLYKPRTQQGSYLAFLGRISPEKGPDRAIEIAIRAGMDLKIAAKIDRVDREYFEQKVKPLLKHPHIEFIGEINDREKSDFLGNAYAYLFPIDWPEPFGLSMIEAMACGTPTIAFRRGSVPELMCDGVTGFVVDDLEGALACIPRIPEVSRAACRACFEKRFTVDRMAAGYIDLYKRRLGLLSGEDILLSPAPSASIVQ
jgi:glycosyltransferase involved in cell wall biosynthesis